jgi:hypothetical protein
MFKDYIEQLYHFCCVFLLRIEMRHLIGGQFQSSGNEYKAFGFLPLWNCCRLPWSNKPTPLPMLHSKRALFVDRKKSLVYTKATKDSLDIVELGAVIGVSARQYFLSLQPTISRISY